MCEVRPGGDSKMGLHDIIQPSLLHSQDTQPFILVMIRIKQKDTDFSVVKFVLRKGREGDFTKVLLLLLLLEFKMFLNFNMVKKLNKPQLFLFPFSPRPDLSIDIFLPQKYQGEWEAEGVDCQLVGEGQIVHQPADKKILILTR